MTFLTKNPGTVTAVAAVAVLVIGGFAGVPSIWTLLVSFALIVLGATLVNGTYVLRRLLVVIPTVFLVTAFTFWLQNGRGDRGTSRSTSSAPVPPRPGWSRSSRSSTSTSRCTSVTCCG